jgi:hypothetical protein
MEIKHIGQPVVNNYENIERAHRILADGGRLWIFLSRQELETDPDLNEQEKEECEKCFAETGGMYAAWYRPPRTYIHWVSEGQV